MSGDRASESGSPVREQKTLAVFQAAKLRGAAAMLEARETPMSDHDVDKVVGAAHPFSPMQQHPGFQDPSDLPRIPESER